MIQHFEQDKYLYHYTSIDKAINIINGGEIWIMPIERVNDPKEFSEWILNYSFIRERITFDESMNLSSQLSKLFLSNVKVMCFSQDRITEHADTLQRYVDSGCIGRGFANSPMWHFYGDQHKGACLIFDGMKIIDTFKQTFSNLPHFYSSIDYIDERLSRDIFNDLYCFNLDKLVQKGINEYAKYFFERSMHLSYFKKQSVWSYENEFRFLVYDDCASFLKLKIKNSLSAVCFGAKCDSNDKDKLKKLIKGKGIVTDDIYFKNSSIQIKM